MQFLGTLVSFLRMGRWVGGMILEILGGGIGMNTMNFYRHCHTP